MSSSGRYFDSISLFQPADKLALYRPEVARELQGVDSFAVAARPWLEEAAHFDRINQALYLDMQLLLPGNNLVKPDRMGMAVSIEARTPFLDWRLMEFAFRSRGATKLSPEGDKKHWYKRAVEPLIGAELAHRRKQMFTVPVGEWFRREKHAWLCELLRGSDLLQRLLRPEQVDRLLEAHRERRCQPHARTARAGGAGAVACGRAGMKSVLFACYGSGHVRMVLPVARALQDSGRARVQVLGLTTAAAEVREAGLPLLQLKDFVEPGDAAALRKGEELARGLGTIVDPEETHAYLGLGYTELETRHGPLEAARRYAQDGRQAFLPVRLLERILRRVGPDLLVATNSPRAERAAILAARARGLPAVCLVDLFAIDEVRWIGQPGYADRICVLNEEVRQFIVGAGRSPAEVVATGNPAFDALRDPVVAEAGRELRRLHGWDRARVLLWPMQDEPARHPFDGRSGDPALPGRVQQALVDWTLQAPGRVLCVRPRPGQPAPALPAGAQLVVTGQDWPLHPLLHAVDMVVTLTSTVGLEGRLAGARLVQVTGSVFDPAMPLARFGLADEAVPPAQLPQALERASLRPRHPGRTGEAAATPRVLTELLAFL